MKFVIFGAGGRVGQNVVLQALDHGHDVLALVRDEDAILLRNPRLKIMVGNALDPIDVVKAIQGNDVVISCLGSRVMDKPITLMSEAMQLIVRAMQQFSVKRVLAVGGQGILQHDAHSLICEQPGFPPSLQHVSTDHQRVFGLLKASNLDWTIVCPPWMPNERATGQYRTLKDYHPEGATKISAADCAHFLVTEAVERKFVGGRVGLGY